MNLDQLRTPQPLRDADFAAIRARVKAEIAQREERPWLAILLRFAFAAGLVVAFVPYVRDRRPDVPVQVAAVHHRAPPSGPPASRAPWSSSVPRSSSAGPLIRGTRGTRGTPRNPEELETPAVHEAQAAEVTRIEITTADPTIRIIWLTPKENNS